MSALFASRRSASRSRSRSRVASRPASRPASRAASLKETNLERRESRLESEAIAKPIMSDAFAGLGADACAAFLESVRSAVKTHCDGGDPDGKFVAWNHAKMACFAVLKNLLGKSWVSLSDLNAAYDAARECAGEKKNKSSIYQYFCKCWASAKKKADQ
jgi:hypothetical protein